MATQSARHLKLHHNRIHQGGYRRPAGINLEFRRFTVQGITLGMQIAKALQGVGNLQQRAASVMPQPSEQFVG